ASSSASDVGHVVHILTFCREGVRSPARITAIQAWLTICRYDGTSRLQAVTDDRIANAVGGRRAIDRGDDAAAPKRGTRGVLRPAVRVLPVDGFRPGPPPTQRDVQLIPGNAHTTAPPPPRDAF